MWGNSAQNEALKTWGPWCTHIASNRGVRPVSITGFTAGQWVSPRGPSSGWLSSCRRMGKMPWSVSPCKVLCLGWVDSKVTPGTIAKRLIPLWACKKGASQAVNLFSRRNQKHLLHESCPCINFQPKVFREHYFCIAQQPCALCCHVCKETSRGKVSYAADTSDGDDEALTEAIWKVAGMATFSAANTTPVHPVIMPCQTAGCTSPLHSEQGSVKKGGQAVEKAMV